MLGHEARHLAQPLQNTTDHMRTVTVQRSLQSLQLPAKPLHVHSVCSLSNLGCCQTCLGLS